MAKAIHTSTLIEGGIIIMNTISKSKLTVWLMVSLMFISSILTFGNNAAAATTKAGDSLGNSILEVLESTTVIEDGKELYFDKVIDGVNDQGIKVNNNLNNVRDYTVYEVNDTKDVIVTIYFNDRVNSYNSITAILTNSETLTQFQEMKATINPKNNEVHVMTYLNGTLTVNEKYIEEEAEIQAFGFFSNFSDCMDNQGVPGWIINVIVAGCTLACVGSAGTLCLACALGVAGNYSTQIGWCIGYAYHN